MDHIALDSRIAFSIHTKRKTMLNGAGEENEGRQTVREV